MSPTLIVSFDLNDSVIKGLQYTLKNYYDKNKNKNKNKKNMKTLVILQQTSPTNVQFWCSFGEVQIMFQKCLKKTDSEKKYDHTVALRSICA